MYVILKEEKIYVFPAKFNCRLGRLTIVFYFLQIRLEMNTCFSNEGIFQLTYNKKNFDFEKKNRFVITEKIVRYKFYMKLIFCMKQLQGIKYKLKICSNLEQDGKIEPKKLSLTKL